MPITAIMAHWCRDEIIRAIEVEVTRRTSSGREIQTSRPIIKDLQTVKKVMRKRREQAIALGAAAAGGKGKKLEGLE
jgi:hypothetical protein